MDYSLLYDDEEEEVMVEVPKKRSVASMADEEPPAKLQKNDNFIVCRNINDCFAITKRKAFDICSKTIFRITRMYYNMSFLYIFLTGLDNVQFYYRTPCQIYSYKLCYHKYCTQNSNKCKVYKSMVVTGLKTTKCHRTNVVMVDRADCANERFLLDDFCNDINRVQMQTGIYEGDYIRFKTQLSVDCEGCAIGSMDKIVRVGLEEIETPIDLIVGSYDLETYTNGVTFSNAECDSIITISYVLRKQNNETHRVCFINTNNKPFTLESVESVPEVDGVIYVVPFDDEKIMIEAFLELLFRSNPDDILDYNGDKFDIPFLLTRMKLLKINDRFIYRYNLPKSEIKTVHIRTKFGYGFNNHLMVYYNHVDVYQFINNSFDKNKIENLRLDTTASFYLNVGKVDLSVKDMMRLYSEGKFGKIIVYNVRDSVLPLEMYIKCQMANKLYADAPIMYLSRDDSAKVISHKINMALFNNAIQNVDNNSPDPYFFNKFDLNRIMSKKQDGDGEVNYANLDRQRVLETIIPKDAVALCDLRTNIKYTGGMVLSPVPGYYNVIFTLDFSQLYTSIMIYYTCCLSNLFFGSDNKLYLQRNSNAITTKFLNKMASNRALYKQEMKKHKPGSFAYNLYDSWQNAAKLVCNSQYGWFGLTCKALANFITLKGREKLTEAIKKIEALSDNEDIKRKHNLERFNIKVVYGDTDSTFVNLSLTEDDHKNIGVDVLKKIILTEVLQPVNATWNGAFKMELENIMQCMLIKGKKSYMCIKENGDLYKRGFNVKKDSPVFLRKLFDAVIKHLLTNHSLDCVLNHLVRGLKKCRDEFSAENCELYAFSQTLNETKSGAEGGGASTVTVAYKLYMLLKNSADTKYIPSSGDRIPYLLEDKNSPTLNGKVVPTQLFKNHVMNWSKHLKIICTFLNDIMSMVGNDTLFVCAFNDICSYLQQRQKYDISYPVLKKMTDARSKDIVCKELNVKKKTDLDNKEFHDILRTRGHKFKHFYEFTMGKTPPPYNVDHIKLADDCPVCNNRGVAAVQKEMTLELSPTTKATKQTKITSLFKPARSSQ